MVSPGLVALIPNCHELDFLNCDSIVLERFGDSGRDRTESRGRTESFRVTGGEIGIDFGESCLYIAPKLISLSLSLSCRPK